MNSKTKVTKSCSESPPNYRFTLRVIRRQRIFLRVSVIAMKKGPASSHVRICLALFVLSRNRIQVRSPSIGRCVGNGKDALEARKVAVSE